VDFGGIYERVVAEDNFVMKHLVFVVLVINLTNVDGTLSFTRYDYPGLDLGTIGWALLAIAILGFDAA
jgi:hypothetical protein